MSPAPSRETGMRLIYLTCLLVLAAAFPAWAGPGAGLPSHPLSGAQTSEPLTSAFLLFAEQEWGSLGIDKTVERRTLTVGGTPALHGFGSHANSTLVFDLNRRFDQFAVTIGVDDEMQAYGRSSVVFVILGDDRELFRSEVMRNKTPPRHVTTPVAGVKYLSLVALDANDGIGGDHADWIEPTLTPVSAPLSSAAPSAAFHIDTPVMRAGFSSNGELVGIRWNATGTEEPIQARTTLLGCAPVGAVHATILPHGGLEFARTLTNKLRQTVFLHEQFLPATNQIQWNVEIQNPGPDWSTPVITSVAWPDPASCRIWTAWQDPRADDSSELPGAAAPWSDPLLPQPFAPRIWNYGEPLNGGFLQGAIMTLPLVSFLSQKNDLGLSVIESPDDPLVEMKLMTDADGRAQFVRCGTRFTHNRPMRFNLNLVPHAADWRPALAFMTQAYSNYFQPPNPLVQEMSGGGAYSGNEQTVDVEKLRRMGLSVLWKLSDDYAYMGMFLPPLTDPDAQWTRTSDSPEPAGYKPAQTSFKRLNAFAAYLKTNGFFLLDYFNTTEFGKAMSNTTVSLADSQDPNLWQNPSKFLQCHMPGAPLHPPMGAWQGGWAVDPGDPAYQKFLLAQARRHLDEIPDSAGLCIDRADYLCNDNTDADDGVSWRLNRPARALVNSWRSLMSALGPMMHRNKKVIFCNMMDPRLDLMRHLDGIYDEFGDHPEVLNGAAFLCLDKPLLAWTTDGDQLNDDYFQRHLYLGAFPTIPYPQNNHCIQPTPEREAWYLDYAPLFRQLRGKSWALQPHCVAVAGDKAKANLFQVRQTWVAPVVFGGTNESVELQLHLPQEPPITQILIYHPGSDSPTVQAVQNSDALRQIHVPLKRGCAMVCLQSSTPDR
jgi:hypothetical protein